MTQPLYSVDQLNVLFQNSNDIVFFMKKINDDFEYVYVNEVAQKLLQQDVVGKKLKQCMSPIQMKTIFHYYTVAIEKKQQVVFEDYVYLQGNIRKHESTVIPVFDGDSQYILTITRDVVFDRELQDKYLFMRSIFFKTFLSTVLISKDLQLLEANPRFIDDFDIQIDDVRGKDFCALPFMDPESMETLQSYLKQAQTGLSTESKVLSFIDRLGRKRTFTSTFSPFISDEKVVAIFVILQEITKYLQQREELKTASHGLEMFKKAISSAADVTFTDLTGRITDMNKHFIHHTGYSREELLGKTHAVVNSGYHSKAFFVNLWETLRRGDVWRGEVRNKMKSGKMYWVDSTIIPLTNAQGEVYQYLTVQFNVSEKKQMMIDLRHIERLFRAITENTNDFIAVTNLQGIITYASPGYIRNLGYTEQELIGQPYSSLLYEESRETWLNLMQELSEQPVENRREVQLKKADGSALWMEANCTITHDFKESAVNEVIIVSREITERKERESKLMFMAYHDSLTHLANRRYLEREFPHLKEVANVNYEAIAVLYIDGDNFKQVNDQFGHDVGDDFLKNFSSALKKSVRTDDLVVRMGGDEFIVIVPGLFREKAKMIVQIEEIIAHLRATLKEGWVINDHRFAPTSSIGISVYPEHATDLALLIDLADRALYEAKEWSKDNYKISE